MAKTILYTGSVVLHEGVGEDVYFLALNNSYSGNEDMKSFELINLLAPYAFQEAENRYNLDPYEHAYNFYINDVLIYGSISSEDNINIYVGSKTEYTKSLSTIEDDRCYYVKPKGFNVGDTVTISVEPVPPEYLNKRGLSHYDSKLKTWVQNGIASKQDVLSAGRNIRFNGNTIIGTNNAISFTSGTLLDTLIAYDDCTDFFKIANSWECADFPNGYKSREGAITLVRQRDTTYAIRRGSVELTIYGLDNMTFKRRIYCDEWAGDWQYYRAKLNTFARKTFSTTAGTTAPYSWSVDAKLDGYKVANFTVMPGNSSARMTNAEQITSSDVISGYSSQAGTKVNVLVFYVASDYITLL